MKIKYILFLLMPFLFIQCKTTELIQIRKDIIGSYPAKFLNISSFNQSRALMFDSLPTDLLKNDTIILIERFTDVNGHYSYTIYQSHNSSVKEQVVSRSVVNGKVVIDSFRVLNIPDRILEMVRRGEVDKVIEGGNKSALTPPNTIIINIGVRNKERERFNFTTLITREFIVPEYWEIP